MPKTRDATVQFKLGFSQLSSVHMVNLPHPRIVMSVVPGVAAVCGAISTIVLALFALSLRRAAAPPVVNVQNHPNNYEKGSYLFFMFYLFSKYH